MTTLLLVALSVVAASAQEAVPQERPAILLRTPDSLPRADQGRWADFATPEGRERLLSSLDADVIARMNRAEKRYRAAEYVVVLEELYASLEALPDMPPALLLLGTTYFRLRRYGDCRTALERYLGVSPGELWRTQALGHSYYSLGEYERARDHYEAVLAAMPEELGESVEAVRGLALAHMRLGDNARALELLARVLALRPDHAEALTWRARILYEEDRLEEALEEARRAREVDPYRPQPWYLVMRILFDLEREDEALEAEARWKELDRVAQEVRSIEMRLRFQPRQYPLTLRLSELLAAIGDVGSTRRALAQVVLARPADVAEFEVRAYVLDTLVRLGDPEGARVAAAALEETCPEVPEAWRKLELFYAMRRDRANQVRCGDMVRRLGGGDG